MRFLFAKHDARIIPNEGVRFPPPFDYAVATIAVENLVLRFIRGLGEVGVFVAPASAPSDWHDLSLVLSVIQAFHNLQRQMFRDVWHAAGVLQNHFSQLIEAFSAERFPQLRDRLEREFYAYERFTNRQWEIETNRKALRTEVEQLIWDQTFHRRGTGCRDKVGLFRSAVLLCGTGTIHDG